MRRNPLNGLWVIVAPERAARPDTFRSDGEAGASEGDRDAIACPFCPGNESMTPPEVSRTGQGDPDTPGWRIRVVPNLYPMVAGPAPTTRATFSRFHDTVRGGGAHEVVILSPSHQRSLADLTGAEIEEVFEVLADRMRTHLGAGHEYVQILVNHGKAAGASIEHPHTQLVAIGVAPPAVLAEAERIAGSPECPLCRAVLEDADRAGPLSIADASAPIWCPWWSGTPFEIMVAPRVHQPRFEHSPHLGDVARSVGHALDLLRRVLGDAPYNVVVHTAPEPDGGAFHWHVHIWPRVVIQAGFESGTGILVNQVPPENAAAALRGAARGAASS